MKRELLKNWFVIAGFLLMCQLTIGQTKMTVSPEKFYAYSIYNFSKNTEWPVTSTNSVFKIAIVGNQLVYNELKKLTANRKIGNTSIQVDYYKKSTDLTAYSHIVFLSTLQSGKIKPIKDALQNESILFVTEREGMGKYGSCISFFVTDKGKIEFELIAQNFAANKLKVSNNLKTLAKAR